jgi:hypothetical protein
VAIGAALCGIDAVVNRAAVIAAGHRVAAPAGGRIVLASGDSDEHARKQRDKTQNAKAMLATHDDAPFLQKCLDLSLELRRSGHL